MKKIWETYVNGNYNVKINTLTGTKIRETEADDFIPEFAENMDVLISQCCDNGCAWCYAGCTPNGKHGELLNWKFLDTLHPHTEIALNLNNPIPPQFEDLLQKLKQKQVIANVTIAQNHFMANHKYIKSLYEQGLVHGIGVSLAKPTAEFLEILADFPTAVLHVINGIAGREQFESLRDSKYAYKLKILILGYKEIGRGNDWIKKDVEKICGKKAWLYKHLEDLCKCFQVVSFDNLALEQLNVKRLLTDEEWDSFFMGEDGGYTFFIDMVNGTFAKNSLSQETFPIMDSVDEMFAYIRKRKEGKYETRKL